MIKRAEACGARALVVTLDTTLLGWRPRIAHRRTEERERTRSLSASDDDDGGGSKRDPQRAERAIEYRPEPRLAALRARSGHCPIHLGSTIHRARLGPHCRRNWSHQDSGEPRRGTDLVLDVQAAPRRARQNLRSPEPRAAVDTFLEIYSNPGLSWEHIATLRERTSMPIVLKGILPPDDARRALELGVDGMIVSNHGGRQIDNAIASLDALIAIREAVGAQPTLLLDSGIRSGTDVLIALALGGADACLIGRPYVYGLAIIKISLVNEAHPGGNADASRWVRRASGFC
jgi:isopentenyl diphosphate isomerase/L-lactate dehydrogenase-like FMN-dependent dehydrogenase